MGHIGIIAQIERIPFTDLGYLGYLEVEASAPPKSISPTLFGDAEAVTSKSHNLVVALGIQVPFTIKAPF